MSLSSRESAKSGLNDPQLINFVTKQLKRGVSPDNVIYEVCRRTGAQWPEAEALVRPLIPRQKRRRPRPIVGLVVFLGIALLALVLGGIFLKITLDHHSTDPIVYETSWPSNRSAGEFGERDPYRLHREQWVEAGKTILVNCDAAVNSGQVDIWVEQQWSQKRFKDVYGDAARQLRTFTPKQNGRGQFKYLVTDTGWYGLKVSMTNFVGRYEVKWEIQ